MSKRSARKIGLALSVVACSVLLWSWNRHGGESAKPAWVARVRVPQAPNSPPAAVASEPLADEQSTADAGAPGGRTVDPTRVQEALDRLETVGAKFTQEQLDDEQAQIREKLATWQRQKVEEPTARDFVDGDGRAWTELTYPSGEVRYVLKP